MSLDTVVTSLIKKSLNNLIGKNANRRRRLAWLKGKTLSLHFTDINKKLIFVFENEIGVLSHFDGKIDSSLALAMSTLLKLKDKTQLASLIKQDKLQLEGDIDVLSQFVSLLEELDFDIAEWLSYYTGDVVAQSLVTGAKSIFSDMKTLVERRQRHFSERIVEEWKLTPNLLELAYFVDSVEDIQDKSGEFESRLKAFELSLNNKIMK